MQKYSVNRRSARVFAMQLLYAMEVTAGTAGECLGGVLDNSPDLSSEMKAYGMSLVDIAQEHREDFEKIISGDETINNDLIVDIDNMQIKPMDSINTIDDNAEYAESTTERGKCLAKAICEKLGFDSLDYQSLDGLL